MNQPAAVSDHRLSSNRDGIRSKIERTRAFFNRPRRASPTRSPILQHTYEQTVGRFPAGTPDSVAVDLGCQWGRNTVVLAQTYGKVIGVDFAEEALASAVPAENIQYVQLDLNSHPEKLSGFRPVKFFLAVALLEMVVDPEKLCACIARAADPGTRFLAFIPNRRSLNYLSLRFAMWISRTILGRGDRYIHNNGLTIGQLRHHLLFAGFETEQEGSMSGIPIYLADRLPESWQRGLLKFEPTARRLFGGSYYWILCRKS